jgi:hypothetical protein
MKSIFTCLLIVTTSTIPAFAQTQPVRISEAAHRELMKLERSAPTPSSQAPAGVKQHSWVARHPALTGTLIGLGIGIPIGASTCKYPGAEGPSCAYFTYPAHARIAGGLTVGLVGAGIGAGVGALVGVLGR